MVAIGEIVGRVIGALARENLEVLASAQSSSQSSFSFAVVQNDMKAALVTAHRELQLAWVIA